MSKRFDIKLGFEELLEVDKVAEATIEDKESTDSEKVLDKAVTAAEKPEEETKEEETTSDAPVEVPEDKTTLDGSEPPAEEPKSEESETKEEAPEPEPAAEETKTEEAESTEEKKEEEPEETEEPEDAASMSEVADDIKEKEDDDAEIDDATEAAATLESIVEELETSLDTGGLSPVAAEITDIAVRRICSRVGIAPTEQEVISIEGFKTASSRTRNTKIAIENISGYISQLWDAIVAAIKRGIEWIKKFYNSIFNDYHRFKKDIKNLKDAASKIPDTAIDLTKKNFKTASVINLLKIKDGQQSLEKGVTKLSNFSKLFFKLVETEKNTSVKNLKAIIDNVTKGGNIPSGIIFDKLENYDITKDAFVGYVPKSNLVEVYYSNSTFPGDVKFLAFYPSTEIDYDHSSQVGALNQAYKESKFSFEIHQVASATHVAELVFLDKKEIIKFLDSLDVLCDKMIESDKVFKEFVKDKTDIQRSLENLIKVKKQSKLSMVSDKASELVGREVENKNHDKTDFDSISSRLKMIDQTYINGASHLSALALKTIKAGIIYASDCIDENIKLSQQTAVTP